VSFPLVRSSLSAGGCPIGVSDGEPPWPTQRHPPEIPWPSGVTSKTALGSLVFSTSRRDDDLPLLRELAHARQPAGPRHLLRRCPGPHLMPHQATEGVFRATRNPVFPLELSGLLLVRAATR
jgi:hypothetical protein